MGYLCLYLFAQSASVFFALGPSYGDALYEFTTDIESLTLTLTLAHPQCADTHCFCVATEFSVNKDLYTLPPAAWERIVFSADQLRGTHRPHTHFYGVIDHPYTHGH